MPELTVNGTRLHYKDLGDPQGSPVLLIPGLSGSHLSWGPVSRRLNQARRLLILDPRDAGRSDESAQVVYSIKDLADDGAEFLAKLGLPQASVVGLSMGGAIAQELAIKYPDLVDRLVLVATHDEGDSRGDLLLHQFSRLRRKLSRQDYHRTLLPWIYTYEELYRGFNPEAAIKALSEDPYFQSSDAYERQTEAILAHSSRDRLKYIRCPTQIIFGDADLLTPLRFARSLHERITNSQVAILFGAGHGLLWTRAGEVAGLIDGFLDGEQQH